MIILMIKKKQLNNKKKHSFSFRLERKNKKKEIKLSFVVA